MPPRYATAADDPEYGREARRRNERDTREVRESRDAREPIRETRPVDRRMEMDPRQPMRHNLPDPELLRSEPKTANSGAPLRQDSRLPRNLPPPRERERERDRDQDMDMYDPRPAATYAPIREVREVREVREPRRTPYDGEFDDMPARIRPVIDPGRSRDEARPSYNEYFLPGEGIDREVIQSEICRYLGQDATCKPGTHDDGRRGYIIRAYRALTTAMINSLREDSEKYGREKETAARRNRQPASFATYRDQARYGGDEMVLDEPEERYLPRHPDDRIRALPVTTSYMPEPGYTTAYYPVGNAPQPPPPGVDPRYIPGNTTPPSGRTPGYPNPGYPPAPLRQPVPNIPNPVYTDARGNPVRDPSGYGYPAEPRPRHR